jgi:hypothetical protein
MAFSCNVVPTVGEASNAYLERIKPFFFGHSYAGAEDPAVELAMYEELPGILVRLVGLPAAAGPGPVHADRPGRGEAVRGRLQPGPAVGQSRDGGIAHPCSGLCRGGRQSDDQGGAPPSFQRRRRAGREPRIGLWKFTDHVMNVPLVAEVRRLPEKTRALNIVRRKEDGPDEPSVAVSNCHSEQVATGFATTKEQATGDSGKGGSFNPPLRTTRNKKSKGVEGVTHVYRQDGPEVATCHHTAFDLETAGAEELWSYGPGYVRLIGYRNGAGGDPPPTPA